MKAKVTVFFGAVVLALLAAACSNPATEAPRKETGRILVSIGVEGAESLQPAESRIAGDTARTVVPTGLSTSTFSKFEATFTATSGGATQNSVGLSSGTNTISLVPGTYTVTITGFTGTGPYVAAAEGSVAGVVVTQGGTTPANVVLGPKTGAGPGTFSYDITAPVGASGALTVTTTVGGTVSGGTVALPAGQRTAGTISLDPGYYQVMVSLNKGAEYAGVVEIIHIYTGLTSALAAQTFTDADFATATVVSDIDLSGKFAAPVVGQAAATAFDAAQYTGAIAWDAALDGENFAPSTTYTATVTLTAKPGYTFTGVGADAFSYSGTTSTNSANTGVVSIIFAATGTGAAASTSYTVDDGEIAVTADPLNKTITQGEAATLDLTVPAGYTVTGWYIDGAVAGALGTNLSVSLDPGDYAAKTHSVTVFANKDGRPYSWRDTFTVEAAGGGGGAYNLAAFVAAVGSFSPNTADTPHSVALDATVDVTDPPTIEALRTALDGASGRYFSLDLRNCAAPSQTVLGVNDTASDGQSFNYLTQAGNIVEITFPSALTSIGSRACARSSTLKSVIIPAEVATIGEFALFGCYDLVSFTFEGNLIPYTDFADSGSNGLSAIVILYATKNENERAGTYYYADGLWQYKN